MDKMTRLRLRTLRAIYDNLRGLDHCDADVHAVLVLKQQYLVAAGDLVALLPPDLRKRVWVLSSLRR